MIDDTTICAVSTASGVGGIAVLRISGKEAFDIVDKIFVHVGRKASLREQNPYTVSYGKIVDDDNSIVDNVLVTVFKEPHSFTGENVVEIACHGSTYIQQAILRLLVDNGCVLATPGEFTKRAFVGGKMDLLQAEAVADLIASTSKASHQMAIRQMRGGFSAELALLREQLLNFVSLIELELDFSEEDVEFADREELKALADSIERRIAELVDSFKIGNVIKNGVPVALVGKTNVGKSTLLNSLLNEERAIVSDVHGTTRDSIEDSIVIDGVTFRFIDTAGIRTTTDEVENLGIERTYRKIDEAEIVLWIVDATQTSDIKEDIEQNSLNLSKTILVINKLDKISDDEYQKFLHSVENMNVEYIFISAKQRMNIDRLQKMLIDKMNLNKIDSDAVIVNNVRHYEALTRAGEAIMRVTEGLESGISGDLLSLDIRDCMHYLGEITGQISTDEILNNIFGKFCIGK